jgi:two-component system, NtrC family, nitrogen regulation response regulator GlnG
VTARRRILVVEDDAGIRHMLGMAIEALGHEVRLATGVGDVDTTGVHVAVLDVRLGNRSALDLLDAQPELRSLPLILCSAGEVAAAQAVPGARVLRKPFDLDALEAALSAALREAENAPT